MTTPQQLQPPMTRRQRKQGKLKAKGEEEGEGRQTEETGSDSASQSTNTGERKRRQSVGIAKREHANGRAQTSNGTTGSSKNRRAMKKRKLAAEAAAAVQGASASTSKRSASKAVEKSDVELSLESALFGASWSAMDEDEDEADLHSTSRSHARAIQKMDKEELAVQDNEMLFSIDTTGQGSSSAASTAAAVAPAPSSAIPVASSSSGAVAAASSSSSGAAWHDASDDLLTSSTMVDLSSAPRLRKLKRSEDERFISEAEYRKRLRALFNELNPATAWAQAAAMDEAEETDIAQLLARTQGTGSVSAATGGKIPATTLELLRMKDANLSSPSTGAISSCRFHTSSQLFFTASIDRTIRLFQIDGVDNVKLGAVNVPDLPITCAEWLNDVGSTSPASTIIAGGHKPYLVSIDIATNAVTRLHASHSMSRDERSMARFVVSPDGAYIAVLGTDGYIMLISGRTKHQVGSMKQNGSVRSATFSPDSTLLMSVGNAGQVYVWDVATRRCLYTHADEGSIHSTAIALDPAGLGYYATGSDSGVVNLYHTQHITDKLSSSQPKQRFVTLTTPPPQPLKSIMNLITPIDTIRFNHDAQLCLIASRHKKDALKMVHVESQTAFANWPTSSTPLHYVTDADFSPNSGYMAIGNDRGRVLLYRLKHYPKA